MPQSLDLTANRLRSLEPCLLALTALRRLCLRQNLVTSTEEVEALACAPGACFEPNACCRHACLHAHACHGMLLATRRTLPALAQPWRRWTCGTTSSSRCRAWRPSPRCATWSCRTTRWVGGVLPGAGRLCHGCAAPRGCCATAHAARPVHARAGALAGAAVGAGLHPADRAVCGLQQGDSHRKPGRPDPAASAGAGRQPRAGAGRCARLHRTGRGSRPQHGTAAHPGWAGLGNAGARAPAQQPPRPLSPLVPHCLQAWRSCLCCRSCGWGATAWARSGRGWPRCAA